MDKPHKHGPLNHAIKTIKKVKLRLMGRRRGAGASIDSE